MRGGRWLGWLIGVTVVATRALALEPRLPAHPPDDTAVFSGADDTAAGTRTRPPAVSYWRLRTRLQVGRRDEPVHVAMFVPTGDGRQSVVSRQMLAPGYAVADELQAPNLRVDWQAPRSDGAEIVYDAIVRITETGLGIPHMAVHGLPQSDDPTALVRTAQIQSDEPEVIQRARQLAPEGTRLDESIWALYQYVAAFQSAESPAGPQDAAHVLAARRGTSLGRARALVALLRASGIPARPVGGLKLANEASRRATSSWVEAWTGAQWVPFDPTGGHYAGLPENYLALYHGDLPLIVHTPGISFDYGFTIRETTRRAVEDDLIDRDADLAATANDGSRADQPAGSTFVAAPVASVVVITDETVPVAVSERILGEARAAAVDCVILTAPFESRFFRETHLERLLASHDGLVRRAHLIVVATADEVGALAALSLGSRGIRLPDARIIVAGAMPAPGAHLLAELLYRVLRPGELLLAPGEANLLTLWEIARANLLDGAPLRGEATRWGLDALVLGDPAARVAPWRPRLVNAWARVVHAEVPLPALTLILGLPVIATVVVAGRVLIGLQTFGTFGPVIVALAFVTTGLRWGTLLFVTIVGVGLLLRGLLQRLRLQAVARLAILITLVAVVMAALTFVGAALGVGPLLHTSIFPMIIMANVIESFAASQVEFGTAQAVRMTASTLAVAVACYLVLDRTGLPALLLAMPEILIGTVLLDIGLGRWRGVRVLEYWRFWRTMPGPGAPQ